MPQAVEEQVQVVGTVIRDTTVVETPKADTSSVTVVAESDLLKERVAVGDVSYRPWLDNRYLRQLPNPSDDLMRDFGSRIYEMDMPLDPQIYSTLSILVMAILAQGVRLKPGVDREDPEYEAAQKIQRFIQYCIDNLRRPISEVMYELTDGMLKMGHKTGELIFTQAPWQAGTDSLPTALMLTDIKTKPHDATAFVTDAYNNVLGLVYVKPGQPLPRIGIRGGRTVDLLRPEDVTGEDEDGQEKMIPRAKFVIPTHKPRNGDPRGTSHLRSVYTPWWKKQQWNPQHLAFVTRFAQPSVVANIGKEAKDIPVRDENGNPTGKLKSIVTETKNAAVQIKGGAAVAVVDTEVDLLEANSDGKVIFDSYAHEDRQIAKALLMQTLTTEESQYMARAASSVHQDVFGLLITYLRDTLEGVFYQDICSLLTLLNFGEDAAKRLTPRVTLGRVQVQDIPQVMAAVAQIANAKGINRTQWPALHEDWGLPPAPQEEWERQWDQEDKAQEALNAKAAMPVGVGGPPGSGQAPSARPGGGRTGGGPQRGSPGGQTDRGNNGERRRRPTARVRRE